MAFLIVDNGHELIRPCVKKYQTSKATTMTTSNPYKKNTSIISQFFIYTNIRNKYGNMPIIKCFIN